MSPEDRKGHGFLLPFTLKERADTINLELSLIHFMVVTYVLGQTDDLQD